MLTVLVGVLLRLIIRRRIVCEEEAAAGSMSITGRAER
jgi:hypothetical protein